MQEEFTAFIRSLAAKSGEVIRPYFANADLEVEHKNDQSVVTRADREGEAVMRDLIRQTYPQHGIIGEEFGTEQASAEFVWILDPIDGTISFVNGCPLFGTLIALLHDNVPVLGAINNPILDQLCIGDNSETTLNGRRVQMRDVNHLSEATLLATDIKSIAQYHNKDNFDRLLGQTSLFRTWGDCYGYLLLASGSGDIMLDPIMNLWDIAALIPVIQGANGIITDWSGSAAAQGNSCVAAHRNLHAQVLEILNA